MTEGDRICVYCELNRVENENYVISYRPLYHDIREIISWFRFDRYWGALTEYHFDNVFAFFLISLWSMGWEEKGNTIMLLTGTNGQCLALMDTDAETLCFVCICGMCLVLIWSLYLIAQIKVSKVHLLNHS